MAKVGDILTFPQMLKDIKWEMFGKQKYEVIKIHKNGDMELKSVTKENHATNK